MMSCCGPRTPRSCLGKSTSRRNLTRSLTLNIPIVSAAMDSVTEARLAITLAQEGGIGIIHKSMSPVEQARQVSRVKKFESGVITDPITVAPCRDHSRSECVNASE